MVFTSLITIQEVIPNLYKSINPDEILKSINQIT